MQRMLYSSFCIVTLCASLRGGWAVDAVHLITHTDDKYNQVWCSVLVHHIMTSCTTEIELYDQYTHCNFHRRVNKSSQLNDIINCSVAQ